MKKKTWLALLFVAAGAGCSRSGEVSSRWKLRPESESLVRDERLRRQIYRALDAAAKAGTDPPISHFKVRAATVVDHEGREHVIVGGNTEYQVPEAIHGETSLLNHVTTLLGVEATRRSVRFIAYYAERCGDSLSCGDCRDYQIATTNYERLLAVCGQASDYTVRIRRFSDAIVPEERFPAVPADGLPVSASELQRLEGAARQARQGGVRLFTAPERHTGAAALSYQGRVYRAAGVDDAAFHYRYPIGGVLQQAATEGDYFLKAILVGGEPGRWPWVSYRDRQYGYEFSSFNRRTGREPIRLILTDGAGRYRLTTFEEALPHAFSTDAFMPEAVERFLKTALSQSARRLQ
ncbi:MAG: hypothetical protein ACE5JI_21640 [Acidobacteriota bacterium]